MIEKPVDLEKFITSIQLNSDELIFSVTENFIDNAYRPIFNDILHVEIERNNELIEIQISKADFLNDISKPGALVSAYPNWKPKGVDFLSVPIHWANYLIKLTFQSLGQLFTGQLSSDDVMGVVGLTVVIGEAAKFGLEAILELMALITISLGAFNLIPIPGLDGGRIIFSIYEMIARKPVSPKVEAIINTIGFLFLILLIVFVTYNDIVRFFLKGEKKMFSERVVNVGNVIIGGNHPIVIQSMTNTDTKNFEGTLRQINDLADAGAKIVRVSVRDMEDISSFSKIVTYSKVPVVADIHFDYRLAIEAIKAGAAKIRINPGNIGSEEKIKKIVEVAKEYKVPIRIGSNSGSIGKEFRNLPRYQALAESVLKDVRLLEKRVSMI